MKTKKQFLGMALLAILTLAIIVLPLTGCNQDETYPEPRTVTYQGTAGDKTYTLKITENTNRAAYTPQNGDIYELTVGAKKSTGTVVLFTGATLTLKPYEVAITFTVTISSSGITKIEGTITFTDGSWEQIWTGVKNSTFGTNTINKIAYGNNKFVAVGQEGKMATSPDGVTWTAVEYNNIFGSFHITAIAYGNNRFVAVGGYGKIEYSN